MENFENSVVEIVSYEEEAVDGCHRCCHRVLPDDMMVEILVRLPVKSLLRFKSVSKPWRCRITSPEFTAQHLSHQKHKPPVNYLHPDHFGRLRFSLISKTVGDGCDAATTMVSTPLFPFRVLDFNDYRATVVGSSHGLVCIKFCSYEFQFGVWNPATREFKVLPKPQLLTDPEYYYPKIVERRSTCVGFSYLPSTSSYKLVQVVVFKVTDQQGNVRYVARVQVLSKGSICWREVLCNGSVCHKLPCYIGKDDPQIVNGCLHWLGGIQSEGSNIVSFDLDKEAFRQTEMTTPFSYHSDFSCKLATFGENLALFITVSPTTTSRSPGDDENENKKESGKYFEVWIYEGMNWSWKNLIKFGPFPKCDYPVGSWGDDEMIVGRDCYVNGSYAYVSNPHKNDTRISLCREEGECYNVFHPYKESLVHV